MNKQAENKEVKKITDEELKELQDQVSRINSAQLRLGGIESQKHTLVHGINAMQNKDKFSIYIKKNKEVLPWKDFNKNMAISVEYNLEY